MTSEKDNAGISRFFGFVYLFSIVSIFIIIILIDEIESDKIAYQSQRFYYWEVSGIVQSISHNRGTIIIRLKKEPNKKYFFDAAWNYSVYPSQLYEFVKGGDSIYKAAQSKELRIFRGKNEYQFIIGETLNEGFKPKRK